MEFGREEKKKRVLGKLRTELGRLNVLRMRRGNDQESGGARAFVEDQVKCKS